MSSHEIEFHLKLFHEMKSGKAVFAFEEGKLVASVTVENRTHDISIKNEIDIVEKEIPKCEERSFALMNYYNNYSSSIPKRDTYTEDEKGQIKEFREAILKADERVKLYKGYREYLQLKLKEYRALHAESKVILKPEIEAVSTLEQDKLEKAKNNILGGIQKALRDMGEERQKETKKQEEIFNSQVDKLWNWLSYNIQEKISQIGNELNEQPKDTYLKILNGHAPIYLSLKEWIKSIVETKEHFTEYSNENLTIEKLEEYRIRRFDGLKRKWEGMLTQRTKYLLEKLDGEYNVNYCPTEKELVEICKKDKPTFIKNDEAALVTMLKKMIKERERNLEKRKTLVSESKLKVKKLQVKRLNLSPNKREQINDRIVRNTWDFWDKGKGSQEDAFEYISKNSKKLLGEKLSKGAVEGRFKRNNKRKLKQGEATSFHRKFKSETGE